MEAPLKGRGRPPLKVREMIIDDIPGVFHLGEDLFTAAEYSNLYRTWDEYEVLKAYHDDPECCFIAETADGRMAGFLLGTTIEKPGSSWKYGHLLWLGVDSSVQASGVGTKLYQHYRNQMVKEGCRMLLVDTQADNDAAIRFFSKMGFQKPTRHVYLSLHLDGRRPDAVPGPPRRGLKPRT